LAEKTNLLCLRKLLQDRAFPQARPPHQEEGQPGRVAQIEDVQERPSDRDGDDDVRSRILIPSLKTQLLELASAELLELGDRLGLVGEQVVGEQVEVRLRSITHLDTLPKNATSRACQRGAA
jgi:hypothetical protein